MSLDIDNLNSNLLDVLKELGNIGAGNAVTALSKILNDKVDMKVPQVKLLNFSEIDDVLGGAEEPVVGIYFKMEGDVVGNIMFILTIDSAINIIELLLNKKKETKEFDDIEMSALSEIGNILASSYINSLSQLTNLKLKTSVPSINIDMAAAILSVPAIQFSYISDKVLFIETELHENKRLINGDLFLIPEIESFEKILQNLGVY